MRKKIILMLLMAAFLTGGAFAQINMSAGLGGNFGVYMRSYSGDGDNPKPVIGSGFHAFFDATYAVAKLGMFIGGSSDEIEGPYGKSKYKNTSAFFSLGLLGKYPIELGSFTLFPMLGFEYNIFMSGKYSSEVNGVEVSSEKGSRSDLGDESSANDMFILQLGAGADINLTDNIYLRPSLLWGIDLHRNSKEKADKEIRDVSVFKHKLDVGIAIGYKF